MDCSGWSRDRIQDLAVLWPFRLVTKSKARFGCALTTSAGHESVELLPTALSISVTLVISPHEYSEKLPMRHLLCNLQQHSYSEICTFCESSDLKKMKKKRKTKTKTKKKLTYDNDSIKTNSKSQLI